MANDPQQWEGGLVGRTFGGSASLDTKITQVF